MAVNGTKAETVTVCVAVKSPCGLILRTFYKAKQNEPVQGGGYREVDVFRESPRGRHTLLGYSAPFGQMPKVPVVGGYAINEGVPGDLWREWLAWNKDLPLVTAGLIAGFPDRASAEAYARDGGKIRDGLEPMMPEVYDGDRVIEVDPRVKAMGKKAQIGIYKAA